MDPQTLETILRYGIPIVTVALVGAITSYLRGRRGRKRVLQGLAARGASVVEGTAALRWPASPAAIAACGPITWSAHVPRVELAIYGGARDFSAVAVTWQSSRAIGEWALLSQLAIGAHLKKLGWTESGAQAIGLLARAQILVPAGAPSPSVPDQLALAILSTTGARRTFALHVTNGVFHLVVSDPGELDEPLEYWIAVAGSVDRGLTAAAA